MSENRTRFRLDQRRAPIYEALEQFRQMRVVPFDVPGHKRGRGNPELTAFLGQQCVGVDVNSIGHPGGRRTGRRRLWRGPRLFDGGRHHQLGAEHGADRLQAGR